MSLTEIIIIGTMGFIFKIKQHIDKLFSNGYFILTLLILMFVLYIGMFTVITLVLSIIFGGWGTAIGIVFGLGCLSYSIYNGFFKD